MRGRTPGKKEDGYPAYAGIDLLLIDTLVPSGWLPRIRGDRPDEDEGNGKTDRATPHTRGSTRFGLAMRSLVCGYPAYAGIDRTEGFGKT